MKIGLVIAIERELRAFLESGSEVSEQKIGKKTVYHARMGNHDVYALLSGCGEIDAAAGTQLLISCLDCEMIMNFGVTGGLEPSLRVEDLFVVDRVCHYDFDTSPIDPVKKHQYAEFEDEYIPLDATLIQKARQCMPELRLAAVASGDHFVEDRTEKLQLASLGCQICDMEIAAIARTAILNGVPCLSIKCISDTMDGDGGDFVRNVRRSAEKAFAVIRQLLQEI